HSWPCLPEWPRNIAGNVLRSSPCPSQPSLGFHTLVYRVSNRIPEHGADLPVERIGVDAAEVAHQDLKVGPLGRSRPPLVRRASEAGVVEVGELNTVEEHGRPPVPVRWRTVEKGHGTRSRQNATVVAAPFRVSQNAAEPWRLIAGNQVWVRLGRHQV